MDFLEEKITYNRIIGYRLKKIRRKKDLNQTEFGKLINLNRISISNIENNKQKLSVKNLKKICEALDIKSNEILPF